MRHHQGQLELVGPFGCERHADQARGVGKEERNLLRGRELGCHDEVALVLTVGVVDDDDHLAPADRGNRLFDACHRHGSISFSPLRAYRPRGVLHLEASEQDRHRDRLCVRLCHGRHPFSI